MGRGLATALPGSVPLVETPWLRGLVRRQRCARYGTGTRISAQTGFMPLPAGLALNFGSQEETSHSGANARGREGQAPSVEAVRVGLAPSLEAVLLAGALGGVAVSQHPQEKSRGRGVVLPSFRLRRPYTFYNLYCRRSPIAGIGHSAIRCQAQKFVHSPRPVRRFPPKP